MIYVLDSFHILIFHLHFAGVIIIIKDSNVEEGYISTASSLSSSNSNSYLVLEVVLLLIVVVALLLLLL